MYLYLLKLTINLEDNIIICYKLMSICICTRMTDRAMDPVNPRVKTLL